MWKALKKLGIQNEMVQLYRVITEGSKSKIKVNGISEIVQMEKRVKQGDGAPILFNLYWRQSSGELESTGQPH